MKKYVICVLAVISVCIMLLAACGDNLEEPTEPSVTEDNITAAPTEPQPTEPQPTEPEEDVTDKTTEAPTVAATEKQTDGTTEAPTDTTPDKPTEHIHTVVTDKAIPATCIQTGLGEGQHCSECGEVLIEQTVIPKLSHSYGSDDICINCGLPLPTEGLAFTLNSDGQSYSVTGIGDATDFEIVIPDTHEGLPVTAIGDSAFAEERWFTDIYIPDSVKSIGKKAFYECTGLINVILGDGVASIGDSAFYHCTGIKMIRVGNSLSSIGADAFLECTGLTNVHVTDIEAWSKIKFASASSNPISYTHSLYFYDDLITDLTFNGTGKIKISKWAFYTCTSLTSLKINSGVFSIGEQSFYDCDGLTSVDIGDGVVSVGISSFADCAKLGRVTVGPDVTTFDKSAFENCISLTTVIMGNGVTNIGDRVFYGCSKLENITWSNVVTSVGGEVFGGCTSLISLELPMSVTYVGKEVLGGCSKIETVIVPFIGSSKNLSLGDTSQFTYIFGDTAPTTLKYITVHGGEIDADDFSGCSTVEKITFGNNVSSIDVSALLQCSSLTEIEVDAENAAYASKNGYLYDKDLRTLLFIPNGIEGEVTFSEGHLTSSLLAGCNKITDITVSGDATFVDGAFSVLTALKTLKINSLNTTALNLFTEEEITNIPSGFEELIITAQRLTYDDEKLANCPFDITLSLRFITKIEVQAKTDAYTDEFWSGDNNTITVYKNDGTSEKIKLSPSHLSSADNTKLDTVGTHNIKVTYEGMTAAFTVSLKNHTFTGISFKDKTFMCSENVNSIYVTDTPDGASVTYTNNGQKEAGTYTVTATITKPYYDTLVLEATMTVNLYQFKGITFSDATVMCSGNCSIFVVGAPADAKIAYNGNGQNTAGTYTVTATITKPYYETLVLKATMTVKLYKFEGITFNDATVMCSDNNSIYIKGTLPAGAKVEYKGNGQTEAGTHTVTATITKPYYETLVLEATMTVKLNEFEGITFSDKTFMCSANANSIYVTGTPDGASVTYTNNGQKEAGRYTVKATITHPYYETLVLEATMTVKLNEFEGITFSDETVMCSENCSIYVVGAPADAEVTYTGNGRSSAGTYTVTATVTHPHYKTLVLEAQMTVKLNDFTGIVFEDQTLIIRDGDIASIYVSGTPDGASVTYSGNGQSADGTYAVSAQVSHPYYNPVTLSAQMTVFHESYRINYVFDVNGVTNPNEDRYIYGKIYIPQTPSMSDLSYMFEGWYRDASYTDRIYEIASTEYGEITLYGKWSEVFTYEGTTLTGLTEYGKTLSEIVIPDGFTSIGSSAFRDYHGLTSINIPDGVTSIDSTAFMSCSGLTSITVDSGNKVYNSAGNCLIETVSKTLVLGCKNSVIPTDGSVTSIGDNAFYGCNGLTSITIPNGITSIGDSAFGFCTGLKSINIPDSVTSIGDWVFNNCDELTSINVTSGNKVYHSAGNCLIETAGGKLIRGCKNSIIPTDNSVTSIGACAFWGCRELTNINIPDSVTSIGSSAFMYCYELESVIFGENSKLESIGDSAFRDCHVLTNIAIPDSVTSIGGAAFDGCSGLIETENGVGYVDGWAVNYDESITDVVLKDGTRGIADETFNFTKLTSITIPNSVTSIGNYSFYGCDGLISITFVDTEGWYKTRDFVNWQNKTGGTAIDVSDSSANATTLMNPNYYYYYKI